MMMKTKFNRTILAALIVLGPVLLVSYYEMHGRKKLGMPSMVAVLIQPILEPVKDQKTQKEPRELKKALTEIKEPKTEEQKIDIAAGSTQDPPAVDSAEKKVTGSSYEEKTPPKKALHQGESRSGQLLPDLHLKADEAAVKRILCNEDGYLLAEVGQNVYVMGVTDCDNPYQNVRVGYPKDYPMKSVRYLTLPAGHFSQSDYEALSGKIIIKTGIQETPSYRLVFSSSYNQYLMDVQLSEIRASNLNLEALSDQQKPVSIDGQLHLEGDRVRLRVTAVRVAGKAIDRN
jgi:hypothetical protein